MTFGRVLVCVVAVALAGCVRLSNDALVPANLSTAARIPDMQQVRVFGDAPPRDVLASLAADIPVLRAKYARAGAEPVSNILAISGGADDGAFSAGLVVGWGQRRDRPEFDVVTGISAGALVAPFAFLGREWDAKLATVFTKNDSDEIYRPMPAVGLLGGPAVADNAPLAALIAKYVDHRMLRRIAAERAKGRYLLIGTTNIAAQRPVFWDMGRIAQAGNNEALKLFRDVLLASTAVPGVFPPVKIDVVADGRAYEEYHVDGGPTREVFLSPAAFSFRAIDAAIGLPVKRRLYVIRNGKLQPEYVNVSLSAASIAVRALDTLTKNQGIGDILRIHERARADGMEFNLASIPSTFNEPRTALFAHGYMTALYNKGLELGRAGYAWAKAPPSSFSSGR